MAKHLIMTTVDWGTRFQERKPHCMFEGTKEEAQAYCAKESGACPGMFYVAAELTVVKSDTAPKFDGEAALAVGEEAFRAGFKAGAKVYGPLPPNKPFNAVTMARWEEDAWSDFEPSEDVKALV